MSETIVQVTMNVTITSPEGGSLEAIDLLKDGLKETTIPVPSYAPSGYGIGSLAVKGLVEKETS